MTSPEVALNTLLHRGDLTIATAESCTGGLVSARLTSVSGSSAYFMGGVVAYSNQAKADLLGVPIDLLESVGAVSQECAMAMAAGARRALRADLAVSTTGIAGPTGATERKPVGLVYVAVAGAQEIQAQELRLTGDRGAVIEAATEAALNMVLAAVQQAQQHLRS